MYSALGVVAALLESTSLTCILPTILEILSAALVPFYTKVSDVVGRAQALTFALVFYLIGYTSNTFCNLGQIAYGIGSTGMLTLTQVLIAFTTLLIDRGIMFALWDMPAVAIVFISQVLTDPLTIAEGANWRNVYIYHHCLDFRLGRHCALNTPLIIGIFVSGIIALGLLIFWEIKYTTKPIMPMRIWANRTCFGGLIAYYTLYLVVSRDITFGRAFLLERGYQVAYPIFELLTGLMMKRFNTCRPFIWIGITIGLGLMIVARPTSSDAFVVISQIIAGGAAGMANLAASGIVTEAVDKSDVSTVFGLTKHIKSGEYDEYRAMNAPLDYIQNLGPEVKGQLIEAYADSQMLMLIIAMSMAVIV
ncbi:hypothetical protein BGZ65_001113 [Modicella reniformis]|uniref:Uncharacterized protein n=1 Tax=Modicella reniformis TaxID=1440133 RepID=A0A9P6M071_9FUNG|nr:hypothetical protein BGZ65_001113 [Modicella reniformis]